MTRTTPPVTTLQLCTTLAYSAHAALDKAAGCDDNKKQILFMMYLQAFAGYEKQSDSLADMLCVVADTIRKVKASSVAEHLPQFKFEGV